MIWGKAKVLGTLYYVSIQQKTFSWSMEAALVWRSAANNMAYHHSLWPAKACHQDEYYRALFPFFTLSGSVETPTIRSPIGWESWISQNRRINDRIPGHALFRPSENMLWNFQVTQSGRSKIRPRRSLYKNSDAIRYSTQRRPTIVLIDTVGSVPVYNVPL